MFPCVFQKQASESIDKCYVHTVWAMKPLHKNAGGEVRIKTYPRNKSKIVSMNNIISCSVFLLKTLWCLFSSGWYNMYMSRWLLFIYFFDQSWKCVLVLCGNKRITVTGGHRLVYMREREGESLCICNTRKHSVLKS